MKTKLMLAVVAWAFALFPSPLSPAPIDFCIAAEFPEFPEELPLPPALPEPPPPPTPQVIAAAKAAEYGVSLELMAAIIDCESGWNPKAIGDHGTSHGLVQIHLPAHPYVSAAEAHDPEYAIDFLAKHLAAGRGELWTCYRQILE